MPTATATKPKNGAPLQQLTSPMTGQKLNSPFLNIPLTRGYNPRPPERARILLQGLRKSGKSTFACTHAGCCVLDWEGGCSAIPTSRAYIAALSEVPSGGVVPPAMREWYTLTPWERYERIKAALLADAKSDKPMFTTVALDTIDAMFDVICERFCQEKSIESVSDYKLKGAGWFEVRSRLLREVDAFDAAGYGLILTSHLVERVLTDGENQRVKIQPSLTDSVRLALLKRVDQIMHCAAISTEEAQKQTRVVQGRRIEVEVGRITKVEVVLRTVPVGPDHERGCRVEIPDKLVLTPERAWDAYADAYRQEVARRQAALSTVIPEESDNDKS